jgi:hypothetical protein
MITCVFTSYQDAYPIIVNILQKYFNIIVCVKSELLNQFSRFKQISDKLVEYNDYNLNQIINTNLYKGHYLLIKDSESINLQLSQIYSILLRVENKSELYIETNDNKCKGKINEDFITDIIINAIKSFQMSVAFKYNETSFLVKGTNTNSNQIPLFILEKNNSSLPKPTEIIKTGFNILPLTNWASPPDFIQHLNKFKPSKSNIHFTLENPDFAFVVNETPIETMPMKTLYFMMEPNGEKLYSNYLSKFSTNISDSNKLLYNGTHTNHLNLQEYWIDKSHTELLTSTPSKTHDKVLSVCISDRYVDPGHKYRIDLIKKLDKMCSEKQVCFDIHIYGKCKSLNFINYKGECPEKDKTKALWNYKYHFAAENHSIHNYITEKFNDALVSECYLFYHGAPNATNHFGNCFTQLTGDIDTDIETINKKISEDIYSSTKDNIKKVKERELIEQNIFNRIESIITIVKTAFVTIKTPFNSYNPPNNELYVNDGWIVLGHIMLNPSNTNFTYLKPIIEIGITNNLNIFMNWSDQSGSLDKVCSKLTHNFDADIVTLTQPSDQSNKTISLFTSDVFLTNKAIKILHTKLTSSNYNISEEELLKDLIII